MTSPRAPILHNVAWLSAGNVLVKPLWFVFITAACMRVLEAEGYGILTATLSLAAFASVLTEFGTGDYATREVARQPEASSRFFSTLLVGRVVLALVATAVVFGIGSVLGYGREGLLALGCAAAYQLILRLNEFCRLFYRAFEVLRYEAISVVVERLLVVGIGFTALLLTRDAIGTLFGMALGMGIAFLANIVWVHRHLARFHYPLVDLGFLVQIYRQALPIGIFGLFSVLLLSNGPVLIEAMKGEVMAGRYGAAYRVIEMLMLMPTVICAAVLPRLALLYHQAERKAYLRILRISILGVGASAVLIAAALWLLGPFIVHLLAPGAAFEASGDVLRVLAWAFPFMSLTMLLAYALIAFDQQRFLAMLVGGAALGSLAVNLLLIPLYSYYAAAGVLIGGHALIVIGGLSRLFTLRHSWPVPTGAYSPDHTAAADA